MKKFNLLIIVIICTIIFNTNVHASTNTYTRTESNYLVPSDVQVTEQNKNIILNTPSVNAKEKIYDFAELLTPSQEELLYDKITDYIKTTSMDLVIVTTKDLKGFNIADYTYNFYDYNDFKKDGIIFVVDMSGNEASIYMGNSGGSDGVAHTTYTQAIINKILPYVYKYIAKGEYYNAFDKYIDIVQGYYNLSHEEDYRVAESENIVKKIPWVNITVLSLAVTFIIIVIIYMTTNRVRKVSFSDTLDGCIDKNQLMVKENNGFNDNNNM